MASTANRIVSPPAQERSLASRYLIACEALETRTCLEIGYETFTRFVEVHRVGIGRDGGHILSGWQIRGPVYERAGWKLLNLDEPVSLALTEIPSHAPRPDFRRGTRQFIGIICQL